MESESIENQTKSSGHPPFQPGNKYARGGKRPNAGRKSKKWLDEQRRIKEDEEFKVQTARELYRSEQQRQARKVIETYYRLATSGRYPQATLHEIDKIDPDEQVTAPTVTINFVMFNSGSGTSNPTDTVSSSNPSTPIDITPQHAPIVAPSSPQDAPRLTFTDIVEKE